MTISFGTNQNLCLSSSLFLSQFLTCLLRHFPASLLSGSLHHQIVLALLVVLVIVVNNSPLTYTFDSSLDLIFQINHFLITYNIAISVVKLYSPQHSPIELTRCPVNLPYV